MTDKLFRSKTRKARWIAAVSAAEEISRGDAEARRKSAKFAKKKIDAKRSTRTALAVQYF